ncbi:MAG: hypothetical protein KatS3mg094_263 [Candidatus Parcubacteria bacterium]|nr:MAG: hypothetical protein KatS3mg094_263 [Candidatus Parcubacteria bacterium]
MKNREKKQKIIDNLKDLFIKKQNIFFVSLKNIKVNNLFEIKRKIKSIKANFLVTKKNLIKIANKNLENLLDDEIFKTPLAIIFFDKNNDLEVINTLLKFNKDFNLEIIGSYLNNNFYTKEDILPLSKFNTREMIYSYLLSNLKNNLNKLAFNLKYPLIKLKTVVSNIKK